MEISIKTSQHIPMFSIVSIDGLVWQKVGVASDYSVFEIVEGEDSLLPDFGIDLELITNFVGDLYNG